MKLNELEDFPELGNTIVIDGIEYVKKREPVAWKVIDKTNGEFMFSRVKPMERSYKYDVVIPLYTAPPKREPLSSIKILELTSKHEYAINLIRAVEKAHGIGVDDESI